MSIDDMFFLHPIDQHYSIQDSYLKTKQDCSFDSYDSEETELSLGMGIKLKLSFNNLRDEQFEDLSPIKSLFIGKEFGTSCFMPKKKVKITNKVKGDMIKRIEIHKFKAHLKNKLFITIMVNNFKSQEIKKRLNM
jgi:carboxylesterase type B